MSIARRARPSLTVAAALVVWAGAFTMTLSATSRAQSGHDVRRAPAQDPETETAVAASTAATSTVPHTEPPPTATETNTVPPPPTRTATATKTPAPAYLPLALRHDPPQPYKPVLRPIVNPEEDGDYTVEWGESLLARRYELQEDDDPAFGSPTTVYEGPEFRYGWTASRHVFGTYHYRVRGANDTHVSAWSNIERTRAWPPKVFGAAADADVSDKFPSVQTGSDMSMWAGYHTKGCLDINATVGIVRSFVRFDLSAIPPGTPFRRAVLKLTAIAGCWSTDIDGQWRDVTAYRLDKPFDEHGVTWKNRPKEGEAVGTGRVHAADDIVGPMTIDVTAIARRWVDGATPNNGLLLRALETSDRRAFMVVVFGTREWEAPEERPVLTIDYDVAAAERSPSLAGADALRRDDEVERSGP